MSTNYLDSLEETLNTSDYTWLFLNMGYTTAEIKTKLKKTLPGVMMLGEYKNNYTPLECKCATCGHKWFPMWQNLQKSRGCQKCYNKNVGRLAQKRSRLPLTVVLKRLQSHKVLLLSEYTSSTRRHKFRCLVCRHKWETTPHAIFQAHRTGCPKCFRKSQRLDKSVVLEKLKTKNIQLVSALGLSTDRHQFKCRICNNQWETTLTAVTNNGTGCPICWSNCTSESEVRRIFEKLTGKKWPHANPLRVPFLHGLTLDGYCCEVKSEKFPNGTAFERQGEQHYGLANIRGHKDTQADFEQRKRRDWRKRVQCYRHGIRLIRIPYWVQNPEDLIRKKLQNVN